MTQTALRAHDTTEPAEPRRQPLWSARWAITTAFYGALALVTSLLAIRILGLDSHPWGIPLAYSADALSGGSQFKNVLQRGWYEYNPDLGAPWGQHFHDFPAADNFQFVVADFLRLFTDEWAVVLNVYYLMTYPLAALSAAWFFRLVGCSRYSAFGFGILYAFAPYHFLRTEQHVALTAYYPVPLAAGLVYLLLCGRPIWGRRESGATINPLSWLTMRTAYTVLTLALLGTASSYYSVFFLLFFAFAAFATVILRRQLQAIVGALAGIVFLVSVMLVNMAPDILYSLGKPQNFTGLIRSPVDSELYALKFTQLIMPVPWERIHVLAVWRFRYDSNFPLQSEEPVLGLIGATGFVFLLAVAAVSVLRNVASDGGELSEFWLTQRRLGFLTLFGFLVGTVGGLSTVFALLVSDNIRGWNRISIFLALFALASAALVVDRVLAYGLQRSPARDRKPVRGLTTGLVCALVVAVGLFDQVQPVPRSSYAAETISWNSDKAYVQAIEAILPANAMVFQLPYLDFPEGETIERQKDSDALRPYLHSTDLRWSYGGIKGRPLADWAASVSAEPTARMLVEVGAAKFGGIHIDRFGYTDAADKALEAQLSQMLGATPIVSPDLRFAFFDLKGYVKKLADRYTPAQLDDIGSHAVAHPVLYWQRDFALVPAVKESPVSLKGKTLHSKLYVDNPRSTATRVRVFFTVFPTPGSGPTLIHWPDGYHETATLEPRGMVMSRTLDLPVGRTSVDIEVQPGADITTYSLVNWGISDLLLDSIPAV